MRSLAPAEEERAAHLHRSSVVVDTLSSAELTPPQFDDEALLALDEIVATVPPMAVPAAVAALTERALLEGRMEPYWEWVADSGVDVASFTLGPFGADPFSYENAVRDLALWARKFEVEPRYLHVRAAADARRAHATGRRGVILNFQDTKHLRGDIDNLEVFYNLGVRIVQLTYQLRNAVGDGCAERNPAGLTHFGVQVVRRMNELGMLVDVSHCGEATTLDAIELSDAPVAVTHAFSRVVSDHDRGKSDAVLRALAERGGYFGIVVVPFFVTAEPRATLDHWLRHVEHIVGIMGVDHVGIGTDWGSPMPKAMADAMNAGFGGVGFRPEHRVDWSADVEGYASWRDWPNLTRALVAAGFDDTEVRGLLGENFLRVFETAVG